MRRGQLYLIVVLGMMLSGLWIGVLSTAQDSSKSIVITVTSSGAINVRPQPNTSLAAIGSVGNGDEVHLINMTDEGQAAIDNTTIWYQIEFDVTDETITGWIHASLIQVTQDEIDQLQDQQSVESTATPISVVDETDQLTETIEIPDTVNGQYIELIPGNSRYVESGPIPVNRESLLVNDQGNYLGFGVLRSNATNYLADIADRFENGLLALDGVPINQEIFLVSGVIINIQEIEQGKAQLVDVFYYTDAGDEATIRLILPYRRNIQFFPIDSEGQVIEEDVSSYIGFNQGDRIFTYTWIDVGDQIVAIIPDDESEHYHHELIDWWSKWRPEGLTFRETLSIANTIPEMTPITGNGLPGIGVVHRPHTQ